MTLFCMRMAKDEEGWDVDVKPLKVDDEQVEERSREQGARCKRARDDENMLI